MQNGGSGDHGGLLLEFGDRIKTQKHAPPFARPYPIATKAGAPWICLLFRLLLAVAAGGGNGAFPRISRVLRLGNSRSLRRPRGRAPAPNLGLDPHGGFLSEHALPRQTRPRVSSEARFGFSVQLPLPQHVVEILPPDEAWVSPSDLGFGFVFPPTSRSRREVDGLSRDRRRCAAKATCPTGRGRQTQSNMSHGVNRGVWIVRRFEARSSVRPSAGSGRRQRRPGFCRRSAHTIPY